MRDTALAQGIVWMGVVGVVITLVVGIGVAYGVTSDIFGSAHDVGAPGNPACKQCHIPHNAQGGYLWAYVPSTSLSGIGSLCFSCHDGTITSLGQWIPDYAKHAVVPGVEGQDCDRCHDPHEGDNWEFTRHISDPSLSNANLCGACHNTGAYPHPTDVSTNLPLDRTWDPDASPSDFNGTRLFNEAGDAVVPSGEAYIKCGTCHVAHGFANSWLLAAAFSESTYWSGDPQESMGICFNCHEVSIYYDGQVGSEFRVHKKHVRNASITCYTCHSSHGADFGDHLIRLKDISESEGVLDFIHDASGGSCQATCHDYKDYNHSSGG